MLRITSDEAEPTAPVTTPAEPGEGTDVWGPGDFPTPVNESDVRRYDLIGDGEGAAERPDAIAAACGFAPEDWPAIMEFSGVDDPTALQAGQTLRIPPSSTT
jgi:hypothetical protein